MSGDVIELVQGDQNVDVDFTITDAATGAAVNLSGSTAALYYRAVGASGLTATVNCSLPNAGVDGLVRATLPAACMAVAGQYDGEIEITQGSRIQTIYKKQKFKVREQVQV